MTLKLTQQKAEALKYLFEQKINPEEPENIAERLIKTLMWQVYKKLRSHLEGKLKPRGYSVQLTDVEAMAFHVYFQNMHLGTGWIYEQTLIDSQLLEIDKQYA